MAKGRGDGPDPWTWRLTESSPRGRAGELLLLFEAKQGRGSGKMEAAAARLGAGNGDPGEDGVLWRGGDGLGLQERQGLSDELLLFEAARGCRGRRENGDESPGAEVGTALGARGNRRGGGELEVVVLAGARRPVLGLRRTPTKTEGMSGAVLLLGAEDDRCGRRCSRSSSPRALGRRGLGEEEAQSWPSAAEGGTREAERGRV